MDACKVEHLLSEETGAALVHLIRFLKSDHPAVKAFLRSFRRTIHECPPDQRCEFCPGSCLLRALGRD
jgi:hypothetical protein